MKYEDLEIFLKKENYQYRVVHFDSLNFSEILKGKCTEIDEILPIGDIFFTIFHVKNLGSYLISRNFPPVRNPEWVKCYKKRFFITSVDSFT